MNYCIQLVHNMIFKEIYIFGLKIFIMILSTLVFCSEKENSDAELNSDSETTGDDENWSDSDSDTSV